MVCKKPHRYWPELKGLSRNQGGPGRHKCAGCAYERGIRDAEHGSEGRLNARTLAESQAGTGRHKDVQEAYDKGCADGLRQRRPH